MIEELRELHRRLGVLLAEPHPCQASWCQSVGTVLAAMSEDADTDVRRYRVLAADLLAELVRMLEEPAISSATDEGGEEGWRSYHLEQVFQRAEAAVAKGKAALGVE